MVVTIEVVSFLTRRVEDNKKQLRQCDLVTAAVGWMMNGSKECGQARTFLLLCAGEPLRPVSQHVLH